MSGGGKEYNGWSNYETWLVALWLDNEQSTHRFWRKQAELIWERAAACRDVIAQKWSQSEEAAARLAAEIRDELHSYDDAVRPGVYADLIHAALSDVDWFEIAQGYLCDVESEKRVNENGE